MIQKPLIFTAVLLLLILSGCAQKAPDLNGANAGRGNVSDVTQVSEDTVSIDENGYEQSKSGGKYNSSGDSFQSIYFGFGDYGISADMENYIAGNAAILNSSAASMIKIEGNCDEFGTDEYNYALGLKRAKAVKDAISAQGIESSRMIIVSFGESNPVCHEPTDSCYARNRRVDLRLVK